MQQELTVKNLAGLNLRDEADNVADNEFLQLQNVWQATKGSYSLRLGSVLDNAPSVFALASKNNGVWRHNTPSGKNISIYHCLPDTTLFPDNTADLTLAEVTAPFQFDIDYLGNPVTTSGNLFAGGAITALRFCYSWIGAGLEQTYNSKNRAGFPAVWPQNAWANPAHQTITPVAATSAIRVTVPAFPTGVRGANIFMSRGTSTQMVYVGTVTVSAGSLLVWQYVGASISSTDALTLQDVSVYLDRNGTLAPGTYWVGAAWVSDTGAQEGGTTLAPIKVQAIQSIILDGTSNAISVTGPAAASTNGAQTCYIFIGTQDPHLHPMTCVGMARLNGANDSQILIKSIPAHNAQTIPYLRGQEANSPYFFSQVNDQYIGGFNLGIGSRMQARFGFILAKDSSGVREIFPSRSLVWASFNWAQVSVYAGDSGYQPGSTKDLHNWVPQPRTSNDRYQSTNLVNGWAQPYAWAYTANDPMFCYQLGISYFSNGVDIPWMTDGYTLGQLGAAAAATQTILPPIPKFLFVYQNSLISCGRDNQLYGSNANAPTNWATGGTGTLLRFVTIGDALGSGITAAGIFTPATDATNNPSSFLIGFKKAGTWMVNTIPDPTTSTMAGVIGGQIGASMTQISGRVGCTAYRSVVQIPHGTMFLGQDACIYLIRAIQEPARIGLKVQNALKHLVGNDAAMRCVTAVFHDYHYKLSYPSKTAAAATPIVNDSELWCDLRTDEGSPRLAWTGPHAGRNIGAQVVLAGDGDDDSRLVCDGKINRTYTADSVNSLADLDAAGNPVAITAQITSKIYRGKPSSFKRIFGAILDIWMNYAYSNTILFEGFSDAKYNSVNRQLSVSTGATWDASQWDNGSFSDQLWEGFSFMFPESNLVGRTFQFRITKSDQAPFVLASATVLLKTENRRIIQ